MESKTEINNDLRYEIVAFAKSITPAPFEQEVYGKGSYLRYGENNLYPDFLLHLFDSVPLHQSICTSKVDYLMGDGLVTLDNKPYTADVSLSDPTEDFIRKCCFDHVIFNRFYIGVQFNIFGRPVYVYHIPANEMRTNKARSRFWNSEDWVRATNILSYDAFTGGSNKGGETKVYCYSSYVPSVARGYASIKYKSGITSMVTEVLVNDFNKDSLEEGFSAAHLISFFKGIPTDKDAALFEDKFKKVYSGTRGLKYMIDWNNAGNDSKPVSVQEINSPDWSAKLDSVNKKCETNILTAHQATSRILFGVEQNGGIGGNGAELEVAYQTFNQVWTRSNRNDIESGINRIFKAIGFPEFQLAGKPSITKTQLQDTTKEKVYTKNELRAVDGLPPLPEGGDDLLDLKPTNVINANPGIDPNAPTKDDAKKVPAKFEEDEPTLKGKILTEEDFELVKHLGIQKEKFSVLDEFSAPVTSENFKLVELYFDDANDIENYLLGQTDLADKSLSTIKAEIRKELGITISTNDLQAKVTAMIDAGLITDTKVAVKKELTRDVQTLYSYEVRPGYGAKLIDTTRGFCKKLISNDRLYTRDDIQQMSSIFGYDVFEHCGGWYIPKGGTEAVDHCRHYWKSIRAIQKSN